MVIISVMFPADTIGLHNPFDVAYCISRCNRNCPGEDLMVNNDEEEEDKVEEAEEEEDDTGIGIDDDSGNDATTAIAGVNRTRFNDRCND